MTDTTNTNITTTTGEPAAEQAPPAIETAAAAATPATAPATAEATSTSAVPPEAHAAHRQRVDRLLKKNAAPAETPTTAEATTTAETPAPAPDTATPDTSSATTTDTPDTSATPATPADTTETVPAAPDSGNPAPVAGMLPDKYLCNGYFKGEGKVRYTDPDLVGPTAEEIAKALASGGLKASSFNPILRELKRVNKKTMPLEAQAGALAGALVKAKLLEQRKRAPHLLTAVLERNRTAVQNTADPDVYRVAYQHLEAIGAYLGDFQ